MNSLHLRQLSGVLLLNKPRGLSSNDCLKPLKSLLPKKTKVGHTGTLDPLATGLLIVLIGKATRTRFLFDNLDKEYKVGIQFGELRHSDDLDGNVLHKSPTAFDNDSIKRALLLFKDEIQQRPPIISAVKKDGKRLYTEGRHVENLQDYFKLLKNLSPRTITIHSLEINRIDDVNQQLNLQIKCSKGTYIRSIVRDLSIVLSLSKSNLDLNMEDPVDVFINENEKSPFADSLSYCAYVKTLERISIGSFSTNSDLLLGWEELLALNEEMKYAKIKADECLERIQKKILPLGNALSSFTPSLIIKNEAVQRIPNGQSLSDAHFKNMKALEELQWESFLVFNESDELLAIINRELAYQCVLKGNEN